MSLRALIFDVDGTLAETERDGHRVAFNRAFAEAGLDWHWDEARYGELLAVTGGKERLWADLTQRDPLALTDPARRARAADRIAQLHQRKNALYAELAAAGATPLRAGVARLLREARASGLRLAIATTTSPPNVLALLDATLGAGAAALFEVIGAGDVVPAKKPAPDIYHWVLQRLALSPAHCLAIEDSAAGLQAAWAAQIPALVTISHYTREQDFSHAIAVVDGLGEPGQPAHGQVRGSAWSGVVDVETLQRWAAEHAAIQSR